MKARLRIVFCLALAGCGTETLEPVVAASGQTAESGTPDDRIAVCDPAFVTPSWPAAGQATVALFTSGLLEGDALYFDGPGKFRAQPGRECLFNVPVGWYRIRLLNGQDVVGALDVQENFAVEKGLYAVALFRDSSRGNGLVSVLLPTDVGSGLGGTEVVFLNASLGRNSSPLDVYMYPPGTTAAGVPSTSPEYYGPSLPFGGMSMTSVLSASTPPLLFEFLPQGVPRDGAHFYTAQSCIGPGAVLLNVIWCDTYWGDDDLAQPDACTQKVGGVDTAFWPVGGGC